MNERATIEVNGIRLGIVLQEGQHYTPEMPTLVLLHGFTGSATGWQQQIDYFVQHGLRVIALDMLGHGNSDAPTDAQRYHIEHCRADILAAMHTLNIAPASAILLGYSMGGRIALYSALSGYFHALILESASPGIEDHFERLQRRNSDEALAQRIEHEGMVAFVDYWEHIPLFASQRSLPDAVRQSLHEQRLRNRIEGLAGSLRGIGTGAQPSLWDKLATLTLPTLLLAGTLDQKFTATAQRMEQLLPDAHLRLVENAGHTIHLEQPAIFQQHVLAFCEQHIPNLHE